MGTREKWLWDVNYHPAMTDTRPPFRLTQALARIQWGAIGLALAGLIGTPASLAQQPESPTATGATTPSRATQSRPLEAPSVITPELLYLVLVGEMQLQAGQAGAAYSLMLDAARKSAEPDLYRRAINVALQSRSADAALAAAQSWASTDRTNGEPRRVILQILLSQNQIEASGNALEDLLEISSEADRNGLIDLVGQTYARVNDKAAAVRVLTSALRLWQRNSLHASSAWSALARVQMAAGMDTAALQSIENALTSSPVGEAAGLLAIDLLEAQTGLNEALFVQHLTRQQNPHLIRLAYARHLLGASRWAEAKQELNWLTQNKPDAAEAWLMLGALQLQDKDLAAAESSFQQFLAHSLSIEESRRTKANTQAYLSLAQVSEQRQQFDQARGWLDKIDRADDNAALPLRYASLLAREGKLTEAIALIEAMPTTEPSDAKAKALAHAQLLRDAGQLNSALARIELARKAAPDDADLLFEQSLIQEKLGLHGDMEQTLRRVLELHPDNAHAHNALGYSLADRNIRLPEAKALIEKALQLAPGDAFIMDSLGWVQYRMGDPTAAALTLRRAWNLRPDAEIAAHLAEVLWTLGQIDEARAMIDQANTLQPGNETLKNTLERLPIR